MKRLLLICGLALCFGASNANAAVAPIGELGHGATRDSVYSLTINLTSGATAGDLVVVAVGSMPGLGANHNGLGVVDGTVTDSKGNTYAVRAPVRATFGGRETIFVSVLASDLAPGDQITYTFYQAPQLAGSVAMQAFAFSGDYGVQADANRAVDSDGKTIPNENGGIVATAGSLVVAVVDTNDAPGDSFSNDADINGGDSWHVLPAVGTSGGSSAKNLTLHVAYKIVTSDADQEYNPTVKQRVAWEASIVSLN